MNRVLASLVCLLCMAFPALGGGQIVIGSLNDLTGATSDRGKDSALGTLEAISYLNDRGGINGKKVQLMLQDFGYSKEQAESTYRMFKDVRKINLLLQWGYADTQHLRDDVTRDAMVSVTDCLFPNLCDPKKYPYVFLFGADYSTDARAALTTWYEEEWKKSEKWKKARESGQKPKVVCFYQLEWEPAKILARTIKQQAKLLGIDVGKDQNVELTWLDAKTAVLRAKADGASVIWHGNTAMSVATAIRDASALQLQADHIVATDGFDRPLLLMSGKAAEGALGTAPCAFFGTSVPGMDVVDQYCRKVNPAIPAAKRDVYTVRAWAKVLLAAKALEVADQKSQLNGPGIKAALESLRDWSPLDKPGSLGLSPITITDKDHRATSVSRVYKIQSGKFELFIEVDMKKKFPDKWQSWLGR